MKKQGDEHLSRIVELSMANSPHGNGARRRGRSKERQGESLGTGEDERRRNWKASAYWRWLGARGGGGRWGEGNVLEIKEERGAGDELRFCGLVAGWAGRALWLVGPVQLNNRLKRFGPAWSVQHNRYEPFVSQKERKKERATSLKKGHSSTLFL